MCSRQQVAGWLVVAVAGMWSLVGQPPHSVAEEAESGREEIALERLTVVGDPSEIDKIPGSTFYLDNEDLKELNRGVQDVSRVLRAIPGINIQEEDGFGLRPNIGFRGTDVERSGSITLMEDGVLAAPAPYSAPSAYYFPPIGRMEGVEVVKGPGLIKYGPNTLGGSLNLLSSSIPSEFSLNGFAQGGSFDSRVGHAVVGGSGKYLGGMVETYQNENDGFKDLDGGGNTGFEIEDYLAKLLVKTAPESEVYSELEFKIGYYDQTSNETYLGLTDADFNADPFRRYAGSQRDIMNVEQEQFQLTHFLSLGEEFDLTTVGYRRNVHRNWYKLQDVNDVGLSSVLDNPSRYGQELAWLRGDQNSPDDALFLRENRRDYFSQGIQSVAQSRFATGEVKHRLEFGGRFHQDGEERFQQEDGYKIENGTMVQTSTGEPGSNANRVSTARAWSFHLLDSMEWEDLVVMPGVRYERIHFTRESYDNDPNRLGDASRTDNVVEEVIPGVGVRYAFLDELSGFAGIHRGFGPPGPSSNEDIEEETSIAYEAGVNVTSGAFWSEFTFFLNDYSNLLGADTASGGGEGTGDFFNAGEATSAGLEATARYDFAEVLGDFGVRLPAEVVYTFTNAEFDESFESDLFGVVQDGDRLPYIPRNQLFTRIGVAHDTYGSFSIRGNWVESSPTLAGEANVAGGPFTDSFFVVDATYEVPVAAQASLYVDVQNIFDEEYVVARRPAGARPGMPRAVFGGVRFNL